ncbi:hypothetical protein GC194_13320 [bacterium]|nr:hypothetical protein [bacterium]
MNNRLTRYERILKYLLKKQQEEEMEWINLRDVLKRFKNAKPLIFRRMYKDGVLEFMSAKSAASHGYDPKMSYGRLTKSGIRRAEHGPRRIGREERMAFAFVMAVLVLVGYKFMRHNQVQEARNEPLPYPKVHFQDTVYGAGSSKKSEDVKHYRYDPVNGTILNLDDEDDSLH